jgi:hypothetical protein
MRLFPANKELEAAFLSAKAPSPESLLGPEGQPAEWRVHMLTGPIPRLRRHRKSLESTDVPSKPGEPAEKCVVGCNITDEDNRWGWFQLEDAVFDEKIGGDGKPVLLINYAVPKNGRVTRNIRDEVRCTKNPDVLLGRFYYLLLGHKFFLGYFTLTRIKAK